jgi:C4-dicarboxylate-specific signal transduction histidine kinase
MILKIKGGVMSSVIEFQNNEDLAFFGEVNASISHELKNILANFRSSRPFK